MIILYQGDFKEQIEKLVKLLLYTTENCWRETKHGQILYPVSSPRVKDFYFQIQDMVPMLEPSEAMGLAVVILLKLLSIIYVYYFSICYVLIIVMCA